MGKPGTAQEAAEQSRWVLREDTLRQSCRSEGTGLQAGGNEKARRVNCVSGTVIFLNLLSLENFTFGQAILGKHEKVKSFLR